MGWINLLPTKKPEICRAYNKCLSNDSFILWNCRCRTWVEFEKIELSMIDKFIVRTYVFQLADKGLSRKTIAKT
jgi:hypothetical protein